MSGRRAGAMASLTSVCCYRPDEGSKRQRTESASSASSNDKQRAQADEGENKDSNAGAPTAGKNIRGAAARNHRNKELRQREEKQQKDRLDAASKRKGRAERRRGDGKTLSFTHTMITNPWKNQIHRKNHSRAPSPPKAWTRELSKLYRHHKRSLYQRALTTKRPDVHPLAADASVETSTPEIGIGRAHPRTVTMPPLPLTAIVRRRATTPPEAMEKQGNSPKYGI